MKHLSTIVSISVSIFLALTVILSGFPMNLADSLFSDGKASIASAAADPGSILYRFPLGETGNTSNLGVTVVNGTLIISNAGLSSDNASDNRFYRFTMDGNLLDSFPQGSVTGWGFRDLAFDGTHILASEDNTIKKIDPITFTIVDSITNTDNSIHRGLAYDASENAIWSTNYRQGPLIKMNADTGVTLQNSGKPSVSVYGLALDTYTTPGRKTVWYSEPSVSGSFRLSRASMSNAQLNYVVDLSSEVPGGVSGGLEIINNHPDYPGRIIAIMVAQTAHEVLFVDITDVPDALPETMDSVSHIGGWANAVGLQGDYAYVSEASTFKVVDISGDSTRTVGTVFLPGDMEAMGLSLSGNYACINLWDGRTLQKVDISNPLNPVSLGYGEIGGFTGNIQDMACSGNYAYIAAGSDGLLSVDISNITAPVVADSLPINASLVFVSGNYAYAITDGSTLTVINVSDPTNIYVQGDLLGN